MGEIDILRACLAWSLVARRVVQYPDSIDRIGP